MQQHGAESHQGEPAQAEAAGPQAAAVRAMLAALERDEDGPARLLREVPNPGTGAAILVQAARAARYAGRPALARRAFDALERWLGAAGLPLTVDQRMRQAEALMEAGEPARSVETLDIGLREHGDLPALRLQQALGLLAAGDPAAAEAAARQALQAAPDALTGPAEGLTLRLARRFREVGEAGRGLSVLRAGGAAFARSPGLHAQLAERLAIAGEHAEAVEAYRVALAGPGDGRREWTGLARSLRAAGAPAEEVRAALERAITANPADRSLVADWLLLTGGGADRMARLCALQDSTPELLRGVLTQLAEDLGSAGLRARFPDRVAAFLETSAMRAADALWTAHGEARPIAGPDAVAVAESRSHDLNLFFLLRSPVRRLMAVQRLSDAEKADLAAIGISWRDLRLGLRDFLSVGSEAWARRLAEGGFSSDYARHRVHHVERFCGWQDRLVAEGALAFRDPFGGGTCYAVDSFLVYGRTCYLFLGTHPFYLVAAGGGSKMLCLYVPRFELVLDLGAALTDLLTDASMAGLLGFIALRLAQRAEEHDAALARGPADATPRRVIAMVQSAENFAHHIWNFYTGLERILIAGTEHRLDRVIFGGTEFFGPLAGIFPELANRIVGRADRAPMVDPCPFSIEALLVTVGGYFIPETLKVRTRRAVSTVPPRQGAVTPETEPDSWPTLWIGMRMGDKSWVGQEAGIVRLLELLLPDYPGMRVLLDGFSYPIGRDEITAQWSHVCDRLHALAETVRAAAPEPLRAPGRIVNMVGNSLRESVLWAARTDAYLSPVGTTQHKIGWFTAAPGIVYSAPRGKSFPDERMPGAWEAEHIRVPRYVYGQVVAEGERRSLGDRRSHLANIALDPDALAGLFRELLGPARQG
ncbi:hypothetical protein [Muricoccus radiodurans]|uniref:hypothetical protein n=1 Tax=Muricoccus radiodurans TaxID=2231721 RepID=UPI003CF68203